MKALRKILATHWPVALAFLWGTYGAWLSCLRHRAAQSSAFDLGIFTNTLWNLTHGNGYMSSLKGGISLFADHQSPILFAFAPFFALVPRAETLLVLQSLALAAGIIPLVAYARRIAGAHGADPERIALACALLYCAAQPIRAALLFDFHPETLFLPLGLAMLERWSAEAKSARLQGAALFVLALATKESAGWALLCVSLALALGAEGKRLKKWGLAGVLASGLWTVLALKLLPLLAGAQAHAYGEAYAQWGATWGERVAGVLLHPREVLNHLANEGRPLFLFKLAAGFGLLSFVGRQAAHRGVVGLAATLPLLLANSTSRLNPHFHYGVEPALALVWALPWGLVRLERWRSKKQHAKYLYRGAWACALFIVLARGEPLSLASAWKWSTRAQEPTLAATRDVTIPALDPQVNLAASDGWVAHLAHRAEIARVSDVLRPLKELDDALRRPECVLIDTQVSQWPLSPMEVGALPSLLREAGYSVHWQCASVALWGLGDDSEGHCWKARRPPPCTISSPHT